MGILRTFIILLLTLTVPLYGMAAVVSAPDCRLMVAKVADSGSPMSMTGMDHRQHAGHPMDPATASGHAAMQHPGMDDGENCKSNCPCCGKHCACSATLAILRNNSSGLDKRTINHAAAISLAPHAVPFSNPYRPPTAL